MAQPGHRKTHMELAVSPSVLQLPSVVLLAPQAAALRGRTGNENKGTFR
jgi:hypothetical protein